MLKTVRSQPVPSLPDTPFGLALITIPKQDYINLKQEANYWQSQYQRVSAREKEARASAKATIDQLKKEHKDSLSHYEAQIKELKSQNAHLQHLLFGRSTEKKSKAKQDNQNQSKNTTRQSTNRNRGHQPGTPGHGRRKHENLPVDDIDIDLPEGEQYCATCRLPFKLHPDTDDCDVIEVKVRPHIRRYHRKRYRKTCNCPETPTFISPPPPARLVNKGLLGTSIWVDIIVNKYSFGIPINRQLQSYKTHGLDLSVGTIITGMKTIPALIKPVVECCRERVCSSHLKHADETSWGVWTGDSEDNRKHWLWVFLSESVQAVYCSINDTRAATVPKSVIGDSEGFLVCDRYSAYKKLAREHPLIILAFCWAHVRRDFINACRGDTTLEKWSAAWVDRIGRLYYLNGQRLAVRDDPKQWPTRQLRLEKQVEQMASQRSKELTRPQLAIRAKKVLESLENHWEGLTQFVHNPDIPMDNNIAEQTIRGGVPGRKNYYGSGSEWSSELTAWLFTTLMTLKLWGVNPRLWFSGYLEACIANGRKPPDDLSLWIPWQMSESRLNEFRTHDPPAK